MNRRGNGLTAEAYTPLIDLSPRLADLMLKAMREAGIAAYAAPFADEAPAVPVGAEEPVDERLERLYVDSDLGHAAEGVLRTQLTLLTEGGTRDPVPGTGPSATDSAEVFETADALDQETADGDQITRPGSAAGPAGPAGTSSGPASTSPPGPNPSTPGPNPATPPPDPSTGSTSPADGKAGPAERDEAAIWAEIVAAYETEFAEGTEPWPDEENLRRPVSDDESDQDDKDDGERAGPRDEQDSSGRLPTARVIKSADPGLYPDPEEFPAEADDDEHYIPPPPPPLPSGDPATRFGWLALVGGPVYILAAVLLGWEVPGWAAFTAVAAFIGGFVTLVLRMGDDPRDPGDGAVV